MSGELQGAGDIFSFHLVDVSRLTMVRRLYSPIHELDVPGLLHSESMILMNLGPVCGRAMALQSFGAGLLCVVESRATFRDFFTRIDNRAKLCRGMARTDVLVPEVGQHP